MESIITSIVPLIPSAAIPLVVCVIFYIYIQSKRKETKAERDADSTKLHDDILKLQFDVGRLRDDEMQAKTIQADLQRQLNILSEAVAKLSVSVEHFSSAVSELREDIKDLRK